MNNYKLESRELVTEVNTFNIPANSLEEAVNKIVNGEANKYLLSSYKTMADDKACVGDLEIFDDNSIIYDSGSILKNLGYE